MPPAETFKLEYSTMTEISTKITAGTRSPNNLPFLQAQILERIYLNISRSKDTSIEELAELTDYPKSSKILWGAIKSLIKKGFLIGTLEQPFSFSVPKERIDFFQKVIERSDYAHKHYSKLLVENFVSQPTQLMLFLERQSISELNRHGIIHRWYGYLEDFPYWLIEEKIKEYEVDKGCLVLDPFCGSGTTLVCANMFHINAVGFDTNPLMAFVSRVKTQWDIDMDKLRDAIVNVATKFLTEIKDLSNIHFIDESLSRMPKRELNQWLSPVLQREVSLLKREISKIEDVKIRELLLLAMSKSCFEASYVSLCPGTTFYPFREKRDFWDLFSDTVVQIYDDLKLVKQYDTFGKSRVINDTCLNIQQYLDKNSIDFIITSPPYPNDLEYTRQTRLELYLLDFVNNMAEIQQLKRKMVKSSTKLIFKESNSAKEVEGFREINEVANRIYEQTKDKNWGFDYPRMVREYFGDMYLCMKAIYPFLRDGGHFLLVVGDQTVKGVLIPVGDILITMAKTLGYKNCKKELFRMRRSTNHRIPLPEEIVVLEK